MSGIVMSGIVMSGIVMSGIVLLVSWSLKFANVPLVVSGADGEDFICKKFDGSASIEPAAPAAGSGLGPDVDSGATLEDGSGSDLDSSDLDSEVSGEVMGSSSDSSKRSSESGAAECYERSQ